MWVLPIQNQKKLLNQLLSIVTDFSCLQSSFSSSKKTFSILRFRVLPHPLGYVINIDFWLLSITCCIKNVLSTDKLPFFANSLKSVTVSILSLFFFEVLMLLLLMLLNLLLLLALQTLLTYWFDISGVNEDIVVINVITFYCYFYYLVLLIRLMLLLILLLLSI